MPANPHQKKEISLEKLKELRIGVREAFKKSTKQDLPYAKNRSNPFYTDLIDDIDGKAKKMISRGTLIKFLFDDENRKYEIITIDIIEKYINLINGGNPQVKDNLIIENKTQEAQNGTEIKMFAKRIYIELVTRKAAIPIDEDNDVIEDIYNSWYTLFPFVRDEMHKLPVCSFNDKGSQSVIILAMKMLNEVLRPHLTEHHAKFRDWLDKAKTNPKYKNCPPQELQKKYPNYDTLMKSMMQVNKTFIETAEHMKRY